MWTLFVLSVTLSSHEVKVTRYEEYETLWSCNIALDELNAEFVEDEEAVCLKTGMRAPKLDELY